MKIQIGRFQWHSRIEHRRMVVILGIAFVALVASISVIVRIVRLPDVKPRAPATEPAVLSIAHAGDKSRNRILEEEAHLLDPAPLFLPTRYNYTQADLANLTDREPAQTFQAYPPSYAYSEEAFTIPFPDRAPAPDSVFPTQPVEALGYGQTQTPYATLGRAEQPASPLPGRLAYLEVVSTKTGQTLITLPIPRPDPLPADLPEALSKGDLWFPVEFLAPLDITGLAAPPTLIRGSSTPPAVVQYLSQYLDKTLHIDARRELTPGLYLFRIGP